MLHLFRDPAHITKGTRMPTKKTSDAEPTTYVVSGKTFTWTTDEGAEVTIPMRLKLRVVRAMGDADLSPDVMFDIVAKIAPGQEEVLDDMDLNDFTRMFIAWQKEYQALSGATLGE